MSNVKQSVNERIEALEGSYVEQAKEIAPSFFIDLAAGFGGWMVGKYLGRKSLLVGLGTYAVGKYMGMNGAIKREKQRAGLLETTSSEKPRIYYGDNPLVAASLGMMIGGAMSEEEVNPDDNPEEIPVNGTTENSKAKKSVFDSVKDDIMHRLYLSDGKKKESEKKQQVSGFDEAAYFLGQDKFSKGMDYSNVDELLNDLEKQAVNFQMQKTETATVPQPGNTTFQKESAMNGISDEVEEYAGDRIL